MRQKATRLSNLCTSPPPLPRTCVSSIICFLFCSCLTKFDSNAVHPGQRPHPARATTPSQTTLAGDHGDQGNPGHLQFGVTPTGSSRKLLCLPCDALVLLFGLTLLFGLVCDRILTSAKLLEMIHQRMGFSQISATHNLLLTIVFL